VRAIGCGCCISVGKHLRALARECVQYVCVWLGCVRASVLHACRCGPFWGNDGSARRRRRPRARGSFSWLRFGAIGRDSRACWPQVEPLALAPPMRDGLRDLRTRRWSTPPAPSTSSAAPTTRMCGRAPTEVRGRTASEGGGVLGNTGGYFGGYYKGTRGTQGYSRRTQGVLRGYSGVLKG
jgi:hypothetical protein